MIDSGAREWAPSEPEYPPDGPSVNAETPLKGEQKPAETPPRIITFTPYVFRSTETIPRREFVYGKHYVRKFISSTLAAGGGGKSSLILVEAVAMATGVALLGVPVPDRLRVAYWNGEDPADEIERRIGAILRHFKIPAEKIEGWLFTDSGRCLPLRVTSLEKGTIIYPDAEALTMAMIKSGIDVLILDPFVKTHDVPENDNAAIDRTARRFAEIADKTNAAIELPHHVRKASNFGRAEVTADDGRGAGALKDAARCVRVMNRMTQDEATDAQVKEKDRKRYFRVDDDAKANMTPPAEAATWFKLISVHNDVSDPNAYGDSVGVATSWALPGVFADLPPDALAKVQAEIDSAAWGYDVRSSDWAGKAIAAALDLNLGDEGQGKRCKSLLDAWIASHALELRRGPSLTTRKRDRDVVIVGNRVAGESPQDKLEF